ncbi:uncharacterized protein LOC121932623 isoform X2 [Sceloporus undulatus]|uniref:uncharacterized protein LOC121932623 isoform X2 n=1 Tax=Sceloporus undulatus TaxID=8520 RepID=UPI001C4C26A5|nr:uncharacterized protein LOC121932623 isoform X2 [Sceloporus undulatus]
MLHLSSHMDFFRTDFLLSSELILKAARGCKSLHNPLSLPTVQMLPPLPLLEQPKMNQILLFNISLIFCIVLAQALTCHDCKKYNRVHGCLLWKQQTCEAVSGQQCDIRGYMSQGCTRSVAECGATQFHPVLGSQYTSCCNDHDFCNV